MVESVIPDDLRDLLKPFHHRALEAEERLARLEAALANRADAGNTEHLEQINVLESKLEMANAELLAEKEKAHKLNTENEKLQYRIIHLSQALREANMKLDQVMTQKQLDSIKLQDS